MSKTKSIITILLAAIIALVFDILLNGCNPVKQVLKDAEKSEKVFRELEKKHPCINDTIIKVKSDTTYRLDTLYHVVSDTIREAGKETIVIKKEPVQIIKIITVHDTVINTVVDNRRLDIANDSVNYYKGRTQFYKAQFEQQKKDTETAEAGARKWKWYFWLLIIIPSVLVVGYKLLKARFTLPF